ncbi:MAG: FAD-binding protein [Planctomycetes bacterium]|jgi:glycolate oxidase|nr:FAD-binding protein [Planctomycetota bacterium]
MTPLPQDFGGPVPAFRRLEAATLRKLEAIAGPANVLTDAEALDRYGRDKTEALAAAPEAVVRVASAAEASAVLALANEARFPVTPRTGGTGLTGGAVPIHGGVVLSLERMDRILEIDAENFAAVVQPGVITGVLHRAVEEKGLFYPPDPASLDSCTIGGNVAECAGGPRALRWGVTKHFVTGLEVVFPDGGIARLGGKLRKNVTGYDLIGLLVGSEGTLGVVTEITLRLVARPAVTLDFLAPFRSMDAAARAVAAIVRSGEAPAVVEFMDRACVEAAREFLGRPLPFADAEAQLLVELAGGTPEEVDGALERVGGICLEGGACEVFVAPSASMRERMWEMRRKLREALLARCPTKFSEDVAVPPSRLPELLQRVAAIGAEAGVQVACFGHVGDGNVHVNVLRGGLSPEDWKRAKPSLVEKVLRAAIELEGTLSGEHGIGITKRAFLGLALAAPALEAMRAIKRALDPNGILNPGKAI